MNVVNGLIEFAKKLLKLEGRVEKNAKEIEEIRQDLKELTKLVHWIANAVRHNQDKNDLELNHIQKNNKHELEKTVLHLQVELAKFENRLYTNSRQSERNVLDDNSNGSTRQPKLLDAADQSIKTS